MDLFTKQLVKSILVHASAYAWSLQGLGMLRLYLSTEDRLHVWDTRHAIPNVSAIHDHPWGFESHVVAGRIRNYRYIREAEGDEYKSAILQCGPGGCVKSQPKIVRLRRAEMEEWLPGEAYWQKHDEIHESQPERGTVTIVRRTFREDTEHATVFWPAKEEWVSAEPRPATPEEVAAITGFALRTWFTE